jgi:hypothetical protein
MNEQQLKQFVASMKSTSGYSIPIKKNSGQVIGSLVAISADLLSDLNIKKLTDWRNMFMEYFFTQFVATEHRTAEWLRNKVIPDTTRILFLIFDENNNAIGNFGLCNISTDSAELDNLIRGEKGGDSKLIYYSEIALLNWIFCILNIPMATLHAFSNNSMTIRLHNSIGFREVSESNIWRFHENDEIGFSFDSSKGDLVDFKYVKMALTKESFIAKYPWVKDIYN